jgi:DNA-binding NarL/FixJ family response regulator
MLRDIVAESLASEPDMEIVAEVLDASSLPASVKCSNTHVVVIGRDDSLLAARLLNECPRVKVLVVASHGRESWLYELRPQRVALGEISPQKLIQEIRKANPERAASAWWSG